MKKRKGCTVCNVPLDLNTASPSRVKKGWGLCTFCQADYDARRRFSLTQSELKWLYQIYTKGDEKVHCALCGATRLRRLHIDHAHDCINHSNHKGCKNCIRGVVCPNCNLIFIPTIEQNSHLRNDWMNQYLSGRPFLGTQKVLDKTAADVVRL